MQEAKLYLIFEYLTMDLKKYIDTHRQARIDPMLVKSWTYQLLQVVLNFGFECIFFLNRVYSSVISVAHFTGVKLSQ